MEFLLIVGIVLKNVNKDMEETMSLHGKQYL